MLVFLFVPVLFGVKRRQEAVVRYRAQDVLRCESLVLYRIMYGNRVMKVQGSNNFVVGLDYTEIIS